MTLNNYLLHHTNNMISADHKYRVEAGARTCDEPQYTSLAPNALTNADP